MVTAPSADRWHRTPTPVLGGVAIALGTIVAVAIFGDGGKMEFAIIGPAAAAFVIGLVDDKTPLGPTAKLIGSLAVGAAVVYLLGRSASHVPPAPLVVLAVVWFAAVVHAVNLLDNMDGLAAGVGAVAAAGLALILWQVGLVRPAVPLVALVGALTGFLPWNMRPARLFMGDSGSLFIGSVLAGGSLVPLFDPAGGNFYWSIAVATALVVPLGEVAFVMALRWMAGRRATRGGTDHTSHRLVSMGFSQTRAVAFLYAVAAASAACAVWAARSGAAALPAIALLMVGLGLGAVYLARVPAYQGDDFTALKRVPFGVVLGSALARSHAAQVLLDLVLVSASYYAAYRLRFEGEALGIFLPSFTASLPIVIVGKLAAHYASGLYRRSWFTFGLSDVAAVGRAILLGTTASILAVTYLYRFERFSRGVFVIDAVLLLVAIVGSRLSFRLMAHAAIIQSSRAKRVLICGARERGQLLAREMLVNTAWHLKPVGFLDDVAASTHSILGVQMYGSLDALQGLLGRLRVEEVLFSGDELDANQRQAAQRVCTEAGVPVRELIFEIRPPRTGASGSSAA
jgi:UDP-GlcNAc:undecaprenyl-phosphate GlcNAc-1-phosphate transferase